MNEKDMLSRLKNKDIKALEKCIDVYGKYVSSIANRIISAALTKEDIEETVSDVFLSLWKNSDRLDSTNYETLKPYIATITRNLSKNKIRDLSKNRTIPLDDDFYIKNDDANEFVVKRELEYIMKDVLSQLNCDDQACFIKHYYYYKSVKTISQETGLTESAIKSKLSRGRMKLKKILSKRGYSYEF